MVVPAGIAISPLLDALSPTAKPLGLPSRYDGQLGAGAGSPHSRLSSHRNLFLTYEPPGMDPSPGNIAFCFDVVGGFGGLAIPVSSRGPLHYPGERDSGLALPRTEVPTSLTKHVLGIARMKFTETSTVLGSAR